MPEIWEGRLQLDIYLYYFGIHVPQIFSELYLAWVFEHIVLYNVLYIVLLQGKEEKSHANTLTTGLNTPKKAATVSGKEGSHCLRSNKRVDKISKLFNF